MSKRKRIVQFAHMEIGISEDPPGSNKVKYNNAYYEDNTPYWRNSKPYAWCGTFVAYIYRFADAWLNDSEYDKILYVPSIYSYWKSKGRVTENPKPGDSVIFDWQMDGFQDHIGIFIEWKDRKKGTFISIEGNTSPDEKGSQSNGGMVCEKVRSTRHVKAFCVPEGLDMSASL